MHVADEEKDVVFEEIIHFALYLATHVSGNHVVQKVFFIFKLGSCFRNQFMRNRLEGGKLRFSIEKERIYISIDCLIAQR